MAQVNCSCNILTYLFRACCYLDQHLWNNTRVFIANTEVLCMIKEVLQGQTGIQAMRLAQCTLSIVLQMPRGIDWPTLLRIGNAWLTFCFKGTSNPTVWSNLMVWRFKIEIAKFLISNGVIVCDYNLICLSENRYILNWRGNVCWITVVPVWWLPASTWIN